MSLFVESSMIGDTFVQKKYDVLIFCFLNLRKSEILWAVATAKGGLTLMKLSADVTLILRRSMFYSFASVTVDALTSTSAVCFVKVGGLLLDIFFVFFVWCLEVKAYLYNVI